MKSILLIATYFLINTAISFSAQTQSISDSNINLVSFEVLDPRLASNLYYAFADLALKSGVLKTFTDINGNVSTSFELFKTLNCKKTQNSTTCSLVVVPKESRIGEISAPEVARSLAAGILRNSSGVSSYQEGFEVGGSYGRKGIFCTFNRFSCDINMTIGGLAYPDRCIIENQITLQCV